MEGWIKLHRIIQNNDFWNSEPFSRGQAWVDLLLMANHKESFFYKRGNKVIVKRGQVGRSEVELSDRWKWSRTKLRKFLKDLEKEQQIEVLKSRITQVLTIVNYNMYQEKEQQTGQQKDNRKTTERQQKDTYKNEKKEKNEEEGKKYIYLEEFQKIKNGEITLRTQLDKNFHFGLFPSEWTDEFKNSILGMWRYLESKENKPKYWGNIGTLTTQISVLRSMLNEYSEQQVIQSFIDCKFASKKSWNMYLKNPTSKTNNKYHGEKGTFKFGNKITNA